MMKRTMIVVLGLLLPASVAVAGGVKGTCKFSDKPYRGQKLNMAVEPKCATHWQSAGTEPRDESVDMTKEGMLRNVAIYVKAGLPEKKWDTPTTPIVLDQKGCLYSPHVFTMMAGQPITIRNSDGILHNIHAVPTKNPEFNIGQPTVGDKTDTYFKLAEVGVKFKCDVHPWMSAWACVFDHPFHTVSGDDGSFEIKDLPPGKYTIAAWHETFGEKTMEVEVSEEVATADFTFEKK
jgi:plastocyanin